MSFLIMLCPLFLWGPFYRHFGGIELGTGGLVRAYGGVAAECLRNAPTCLVKSRVRLSLDGQLNILFKGFEIVNCCPAHLPSFRFHWV